MKQTREIDAGRESRTQAPQARQDRRDREGMSSAMRQLIMSFTDDDPERTWDPGVYSRRVEPAR